MDNVEKLPTADHASITAMMNMLEFNAPAIKDAASFIANHPQGPEAAMSEFAEKWGNFKAPEFFVMSMIVEAIFKDRISRSKREMDAMSAMIKG